MYIVFAFQKSYLPIIIYLFVEVNINKNVDIKFWNNLHQVRSKSKG